MIKELIHAVYNSHKPFHTNQQYSQIHIRISFFKARERGAFYDKKTNTGSVQ